ncbi:DUF262 domain-containing protein [Enterococcus sp. 669A]|uniref:DUF262 domain-containing protein n=1 Tax=Candidatus Enterococcus moelleringii TaxID=2815325 RepID=A0ABS3LDW6_9ENTE|nr:DUF262 domain-containing protein [Enterococcus sp. 669A]MBO1307813.1 DUF262 domain-containing protein [Enterococcus sp. 669A]
MSSDILQKKVGELFLDYSERKKKYVEKNHYKYIIPSYQRAYKWDVELGEILFRDLILPKGEGYNFGFVTLSVLEQNDDRLFEVIDGQQRITTIYIIMLVLYNRLCCLNAGETEKKRLEKFINNFPFSSEDSPTIPLLEKLHKDALGKGINSEDFINLDSSPNPIFDNFKKIDDTLSQFLQGMENDESIGTIVGYIKCILEQKIIILKYRTPALALDSFIALNMKGRPLDAYEIFSALCLKIIDSTEEMNEYKKKLNGIFNMYSANANLLGFQNFNHFLKTMITCMDYEKYSSDPERINEINLKIPNHYIEENYKSPTSIMNFIDKLGFYLKKVINFLKTGKLTELEGFCTDKSKTKNINKRLEEIEWLVYGWNNTENDGAMLMVIRKYLYALLIQIEKEKEKEEEKTAKSYKLIYKCLTEITLSLYHHHLIGILGSNYLKLRQENLTISSAHDIKHLYSESFDWEEIFKAELAKENYGISKAKFLKMNLIFQVKRVKKTKKLMLMVQLLTKLSLIKI